MTRGEKTRARMLQTTLELMWLHGYGSITVDSICERAEIQKGSFYHFFRSKAESLRGFRLALTLPYLWEAGLSVVERVPPTMTKGTGPMRHPFSYEFRNQPYALQSLKQELEITLFAELKHCALCATILLVIDELVSNLLKYGFSGAPDERSYLNVAFDDDWLEIELKDNGHPFNPLLQPQPKLLDQELSDRQVGGLGVYLVLKMMDETYYEWIEPWNYLRLRKRREKGRE